MPPSSLLAGFPHQLNADMHLLYWLDQKGFEYDIVTDHELHYEGQAVLAYRTVRPTQTILRSSARLLSQRLRRC